jgi:hypothetical protein
MGTPEHPYQGAYPRDEGWGLNTRVAYHEAYHADLRMYSVPYIAVYLQVRPGALRLRARISTFPPKWTACSPYLPEAKRASKKREFHLLESAHVEVRLNPNLFISRPLGDWIAPSLMFECPHMFTPLMKPGVSRVEYKVISSRLPWCSLWCCTEERSRVQSDRRTCSIMSLFYPRLLVSLLMFKLAFAFDELIYDDRFSGTDSIWSVEDASADCYVADETLIPLDDPLFVETNSGLPYEDTFGPEETLDLSSADSLLASNFPTENPWLEGDLWNEGPDVPLSDIDYLAPWGEQIAQAPADLCAGTGLGVPVCAYGNVDDHDRPYPTKLRKFSLRGTMFSSRRRFDTWQKTSYSLRQTICFLEIRRRVPQFLLLLPDMEPNRGKFLLLDPLKFRLMCMQSDECWCNSFAARSDLRRPSCQTGRIPAASWRGSQL